MRTILVLGVLLAIMSTSSVQARVQGTRTKPALSSSDMQAIKDAADHMLRCQLPNGLVASTPDEQLWAVPYFSNLGCVGLLRAYQVTGERRYLQAVLRYEDWYAAHINPDGTMYDWKGTRTQPVATGSYDSSDSYSSTFISLCHETYSITHDRKWLQAMFPTIIHCVEGTILTWQGDGLTWGKPDYKVKYLMDNLEVRLGLRAAVTIAEVFGSPKAKEWKSLLEQNRQGLKKLWMEKEGWFAMAMFEDGSVEKKFAKWYPDGMANAMALGYILDKRDPKAQKIAGLIEKTFPGDNDYWRFIAMWKFGYKDEAAAIRKDMGSKFTQSWEKGLYIRSFVPEKDAFFFNTDYLNLPGLTPAL